MKIAYLSTFYPFRGGIAQFNSALFKALTDKGHEVKAFTFTRQYPELLFPGKTQYAEAKDSAEDVGAVRVLDTVNPLTYGKTAKAIMRFKPDMMITKYWMPFFSPSLGTVAKRLKKNGVVNVSVLDNVIPHEQKFYDKALTKYFLKNNHAFVAMSQNVVDDLLTFAPKANYALHPHPMFDFGVKVSKEEAKAKLGLSPTDSYMLFFGFIRRYKGLDLLLEAMSDPRIKNGNVKLIVAGEYYEDAAFYENKLKEYGIQDKVAMHTNYIPSNMVRYYFSAADIVVQPYRSATQSGVTQIAYHFDKPMLVTDVGGLSEIVPNGKVGYVVRPNSLAIADAINDFYQNSREAAFVSNTQNEKKRFQWDSFATAIEGLYKKAKA
ncbi:MAG TPA: glycosyltransferase [Bacteroidia bacterium]|jgi:D-inositol-3-phosphate glycosyltransferase|nr:glycosyltransferase [Bacteroidia bacterium]